jgi:lysine-N-methylase
VTPYEIAPDARFTCQQCAGCCYHWYVYLTPEEHRRLASHDWAAESPRLAGRALFEEVNLGGQPAVRLAKIESACAFLEPDDLCLIHKVQGLHAKPGPCKQYPFHFVRTPDEVAVSLDFACSSVLADEGAPLREQPEDVEIAYDAAQSRVALTAHGLPASGGIGEYVWLQPKQPLHWRNYRALEAALVGALLQPEQPLGARLLALDRLLHLAAERFSQSLGTPNAQFEDWTAGLAASGFAALWAAPPKVTASPLRQRAVLAPFLGGLEQQWQAINVGNTTGLGMGTRLTFAIMITNGFGTLPLGSFGASVELGRMSHTRFDQDAPDLSSLFTRYLKGHLQRKSLLDGTDVFQGFRYLLLSFAAARWYAVARAAVTGRPVVELEDLRHGIRLVEKGLGHAEGLRSTATQRVVRFLFEHVGSPSTMIHNYYTGFPGGA